MWKVLICDSDLSFSEELKRKSLAIAEEGVQGVKLFRGKADLEQYVSAHPDEANMVFLEVELEGCFGIEAGKKVLQMQPDSQLIFISAKDTYYQEVYEVDHVYLLKKPLEDECLKQAVRRAEKKLDQASRREFVIANKQGVQKVPLERILYFEKEKRRIHVHTTEGVVTYYGKFEEMDPQVDRRFLRCHNSYVVNITRVQSMNAKKFLFEDGREIPISKSYYAEIKSAYMNYLNGDF